MTGNHARTDDHASTWIEARLPAFRPGLAGVLRIVWRGTMLAVVIYGGLVLFLPVRLVERALAKGGRPLTSCLVQGTCRLALVIMRLSLVCHGRPMRQPGATVANHSGWLDVLVLNAAHHGVFVAKSEVSGWPGIGWLARATGTAFITRKGTEARRQQTELEARLQAGQRLVFFPEGTSTDSLRVLPFKSTLFAAFFAPGLRTALHVQPVSVVYHAPPGTDARQYGWWGDMDFASHLARLLANPGRGRVEVRFHPSLAVADFADRKALAKQCETVVRSAGPMAGPAHTDQTAVRAETPISSKKSDRSR